MQTLTTPTYDARWPFAVIRRWPADCGGETEILRSCCCPRRAEEECRRHLNGEVVALRPVPAKGAFGGWRVAPSSDKPCDCVGQMSIEDWPAA